VRGAHELERPRREVVIDVGGHEPRGATRARKSALLMIARPHGADGPRRLALGPADGADVLAEILHTRRNGRPHQLQLVELDGELADRLREQGPDEVYFVLGGHIDEQLVAGIGARLLMDGVALHLVFPALGGPPVRAALGRLGSRSCISVHAVGESQAGGAIRRVLDVVGAAVLIALVSPVLAVVGAVVWWKMGFPVIYAQERVGQFARRFSLYKFRSMVKNAEEILRASPEIYRRYVAFNYKLPESEDPRITSLGRFLRRTSLDELPQLWNVLRGDMSLVGPRPVVPEEISEYGDYARMLLRVKPGLTGAWQVAGRSKIPYPERAHMDLHYVAARSLADDVSILLRTLPAVIRRRGAL
jgi:lipopolysaccharide/colanic/teichoic acid biosynthesis glycosyltransferase